MTAPTGGEAEGKKVDVSEYLAGTSVGGLAQANSTAFIAFRLMWLVVFVLGLAATIFNVVTITNTYLGYPIQVKVSLIRNETLEFPGVTLCNLNPVKKSKVRCTKYASLSDIQSTYQRALWKYIKDSKNTSAALTTAQVVRLLGKLETPRRGNASDPACRHNGSSTTTTASLLAGRRRKRAALRAKRDAAYYDYSYSDPPQGSTGSNYDYYDSNTSPSPSVASQSATSSSTSSASAVGSSGTDADIPASQTSATSAAETSDPSYDYDPAAASETVTSESSGATPSTHSDDPANPASTSEATSDPSYDYSDYGTSQASAGSQATASPSHSSEATPSGDSVDPATSEATSDASYDYDTATEATTDQSNDYSDSGSMPATDQTATDPSYDYGDYGGQSGAVTNEAPTSHGATDETYGDATDDSIHIGQQTTPASYQQTSEHYPDYGSDYSEASDTTQSSNLDNGDQSPSSTETSPAASDDYNYDSYNDDATTPSSVSSATADGYDDYADNTNSAQATTEDYFGFADQDSGQTTEPTPATQDAAGGYDDYFNNNNSGGGSSATTEDYYGAEDQSNNNAAGETTPASDGYGGYDDNYGDDGSPSATTEDYYGADGANGNAEGTATEDYYGAGAESNNNHGGATEATPDSYGGYDDNNSGGGTPSVATEDYYGAGDESNNHGGVTGATPASYGGYEDNFGGDGASNGGYEDNFGGDGSPNGGYEDNYNMDGSPSATTEDNYGGNGGNDNAQGATPEDYQGSYGGDELGGGGGYQDDFGGGGDTPNGGSANASSDGDGSDYDWGGGYYSDLDSHFGSYDYGDWDAPTGGMDYGMGGGAYGGMNPGDYSAFGGMDYAGMAGGDYLEYASMGLQSELAAFDFLGNLSEAQQNDFSLLLKKGKLVDLTDVVELVQFSDAEFDRLSHDAKDLLLECTNDRRNCDSANFKPTRSRRYGNCITFNSKYQLNATVGRTRKSGSRFGLRVTLNIQAHEYLGLLASEYGVKVAIHPADVSPEPEDDGFIAEPGKLTSVAVSQHSITRLPLPFKSACLDRMPEELEPYQVDQSVYTIRQCEKACLDRFLHSRCGCVDQTHVGGSLKGLRVCDFFNEDDRTCRAKVIAQDTLPLSHANSTACDCRPQCRETQFHTDISTTDWPSDSYRKLKIINFIGKHDVADMFFKDALEKAKAPETDATGQPVDKDDLATDIRKNLVRIHVYYKSKTYEAIEEEPSYPLSNLFADVGGSVGLYLGMSAVTIMEVIQLMAMVCMACCGRRGRRTSPSSPTEEELYRKASAWDAAPSVKYQMYA